MTLNLHVNQQCRGWSPTKTDWCSLTYCIQHKQGMQLCRFMRFCSPWAQMSLNCHEGENKEHLRRVLFLSCKFSVMCYFTVSHTQKHRVINYVTIGLLMAFKRMLFYNASWIDNCPLALFFHMSVPFLAKKTTTTVYTNIFVL